MKINQQYQSLHSHGDSEVDWVAVQEVERDICLLYHQLADYSYIMGDLYYGNVYALPYWECLNIPGLDEPQRNFIRDGCLVMILAMCWDEIDGSGSYLSKFLDACIASVTNLNPEGENTISLHNTVILALRLVKDGGHDSQELADLSLWVHKTYVREYFMKIADEFNSSPYFQDGK
jgi:hypothetical protein